MKKGFTLIELMIVVAIIAIIATFAIPNLLRSRIVANETGAIAGLKALVSHEEVFRSSDSDGDGTKNFLTSEVAGFYVCKNTLGNPIKAIDVSFGKADFTHRDTGQTDGVTSYDPNLPGGSTTPQAKTGYRYTAMDTMLDEDGSSIDVNDAAVTGVVAIGTTANGMNAAATAHTALYGFCAYPDNYGRSGQRTFIVSQEGQVYGVDKGGDAHTAWPAVDPTTVEGASDRKWSSAE